MKLFYIVLSWKANVTNHKTDQTNLFWNAMFFLLLLMNTDTMNPFKYWKRFLMKNGTETLIQIALWGRRLWGEGNRITVIPHKESTLGWNLWNCMFVVMNETDFEVPWKWLFPFPSLAPTPTASAIKLPWLWDKHVTILKVHHCSMVFNSYNSLHWPQWYQYKISACFYHNMRISNI